MRLRAEEGTVWSAQAEIVDLFATTPQNLTQHIKAILEEGVLQVGATCKEYLKVRREITWNLSKAGVYPQFSYQCSYPCHD